MPVNWNAETAAHLLRRAGWGPKPNEIDKKVQKGMDPTIESLFTPWKKGDKYWKKFDSETGLRHIQEWWLHRMLKTKSPLIEKLTLFWHNHFATSIGKVGHATWMHQQNRTIRKHCLGKFRDLLLAMAQDPAMLVWLDNNTSIASAPNENFSRELMELFTTGVFDKDGKPNYTEKDVQEAARAFTGWSVNGYEGTFMFKEWAHDGGKKKFKGVKGKLDGSDIVDILALDPATARRVAWKLFSFFAYEVPLNDPILDPLEQTYLAKDTRIRPVIEKIFRMDEFYSPAAMNQRVKSPMEFLIGSVRMLQGKLSKKESWMKWELGHVVENLGQSIFAPPSVFGWKEGLPWVSSNGLLNRLRVAERIADSRKSSDPVFLWNPKEILPSKTEWPNLTASDVVQLFLDHLGPVPAAPSTVASLETYLVADEFGNPQPFVLDNQIVDAKVRGLVSLILSCPEYQFA